MANSPRNSIGNVRSDMDIAYPEHLSRLHRHSVLVDYSKCYFNPKKNTRNRRGNRYRTQPVTFDEIQEVDEESQNSEDQGHSKSALSTSKLELDFYRFTKALEAKCKKSSTSAAPDIISSKKDQSNGAQGQSLNARPDEQRRWTDYSREGSI